MDLTTLSLAKKYTDEKCAGGSSGGGLPVVALANEAFDFSQGANIHNLSADEVAAVEAATSKAMPIAVRFNAIIGAPSTVALVFDYAETGGMVVYQGIYLTTQILLAPKAAIDEGEGWVFMTQPMG